MLRCNPKPLFSRAKLPVMPERFSTYKSPHQSSWFNFIFSFRRMSGLWFLIWIKTYLRADFKNKHKKWTKKLLQSWQEVGTNGVLPRPGFSASKREHGYSKYSASWALIVKSMLLITFRVEPFFLCGCGLHILGLPSNLQQDLARMCHASSSYIFQYKTKLISQEE